MQNPCKFFVNGKNYISQSEARREVHTNRHARQRRKYNHDRPGLISVSQERHLFMRSFRLFALVFLTISILTLSSDAHQTPTKKKPLSLDTDDISTPTRVEFPTPDSITRSEMSALLNKVSSFRCAWGSNYGNYHIEAKGEFTLPDREHVSNVGGNLLG